jgi:hypothetical protein
VKPFEPELIANQAHSTSEAALWHPLWRFPLQRGCGQPAGGINPARDPRNGRTFEHLGEDPLLAAVLGATWHREAARRNAAA